MTLFQSIKRLLKQIEIGGVAGFFARAVHPFFLEQAQVAAV
jgi:hypothetical protein